MQNDYSRNALLGFLDFLGNKGLMKIGTVTARKAASNNVLSVLDDKEAADLRLIDMNSVMDRFVNINHAKYTAGSLRTYKSKAASAIDDFLRYKANPANFTVEHQTRRSTKKMSGSNSGSTGASNSNPLPSIPHSDGSIPERTPTFDIPVPLRPGYIVQLNGIPTDLTQMEAQKISKVIVAMAHEAQE